MDRIEKTIVLRAPIERVWKAISDAKEFGTWFGVEFDGAFAVGKAMVGRIVPTQVDAEVAKLQEPHRGAKFEITVQSIEPMTLFSFRWHPFAIDPKVDYSKEEATLVEFRLTPEGSATRLVITESGFDRVPLERRAKAFTANEDGWAHQCKLLEKYVSR